MLTYGTNAKTKTYDNLCLKLQTWRKKAHEHEDVYAQLVAPHVDVLETQTAVWWILSRGAMLCPHIHSLDWNMAECGTP